MHGDRELLTQLFANLIENAIGHSSTGAEICALRRRQQQVRLVVVADNGPGIPAEFRRKVLQRFYRLEASRTTPVQRTWPESLRLQSPLCMTQ